MSFAEGCRSLMTFGDEQHFASSAGFNFPSFALRKHFSSPLVTFTIATPANKKAEIARNIEKDDERPCGSILDTMASNARDVERNVFILDEAEEEELDWGDEDDEDENLAAREEAERARQKAERFVPFQGFPNPPYLRHRPILLLLHILHFQNAWEIHLPLEVLTSAHSS
ncbi:hypothetical protein EV360DRAFT_69622, partial [Lentinula raphanica]